MTFDSSRKWIGILLFDDVEELDAVGPWEVFAFWATQFPQDGYGVLTMSPDGGPVRCAKGLRLFADTSFAEAPALEVLLHPGGQGTRPLMRDPVHLDWLRQQRSVVPLMTSVCTGSLVLAAAGLLKNRPATTYWSAMELLVQTDPTIRADPEARYVDDGDVISSAGVSAGIDMALHVVRRLAGEPRAREVRRGIQYDPAPPV